MMNRRQTILVTASALSIATLPAAVLDALPDCEWCGADEAPAHVGTRVDLAPEDEPGERLILRGRVLRARMPVADVLVYAYHTNAAGHYPRRGDERGNGRRHGYLRGWVRTDRDGRFQIRTIRPGPYPGRPSPAHIHMTVREPGRREWWIDETWFGGDSRITPAERARLQGRGGPAIVALSRSPDGTWLAERVIDLDAR